jgi:L-proline amide hydrolase
VVFEESSHMPHVEEPEAFLDAVEAFLRSID